MPQRASQYELTDRIVAKRRINPDSAIDPLAPFSLLLNEQFNYVDGALATVSSPLWLLDNGTMGVVSSRLPDMGIGNSHVSVNFALPAFTFPRNIPFAVSFVGPLTDGTLEAPNANDNGFGVTMRVSGTTTFATAAGISIARTNDGLSYNIHKILFGVSPVVASVAASGGSVEFIATYTINGGNYDVNIYADGGLVHTDLAAFPTAATLITPGIEGFTTGTLIAPRGMDSCRFWTIP